MLALRTAQGAGASASLALGRAVARDLYDGPALIRVMALLTMGMAVVPGLAPIAGGILTEIVGWRGALGFAGVVGAVLLLLTAIHLPETNASPLTTLDGGEVARLYTSLIGHSTFRRNALSNTLLLSALYAFFAGAPLVLIGSGRLSPTQFGLVPAATAVTYFGGWVLLRVAGHHVLHRFALAGARAATVLGSLFLLGMSLAHELDPWITMVGAAVYAFGLGALLPVGRAGALMPFGKEAGTASALLGALQMVGGALAGAAVGWIGGEPAIAFPAFMLACVAGAIWVGPRHDIHEKAGRDRSD